MAPPGMPKMFSVPAASSDLIRLCAPVTTGPLPGVPVLWVIACPPRPDGSSLPLSGKSATRPTWWYARPTIWRQPEPTPSPAAYSLMVRASFTSRSVTPPTSWLESVTSRWG